MMAHDKTEASGCISQPSVSSSGKPPNPNRLAPPLWGARPQGLRCPKCLAAARKARRRMAVYAYLRSTRCRLYHCALCGSWWKLARGRLQ